ncbi:hypothetical protein [Pontibacter russatus]|uniref:hypothetical protein n=1 Tax=Pontibacter russatus TaxID=2694929 RepID=UPI00192A5447|nr:hypothetical protein [Pontibacter russatus]
MVHKKQAAVGFADLAVEGHKIKNKFLGQINPVVDWHPLSSIMDKHYVKGASATGTPAYCRLPGSSVI